MKHPSIHNAKACLTMLLFVATLAAGSLSCGSAAALDLDDNLDMAEAKLVSDKEMGMLRGGFFGKGWFVRFGMDVQTHIDGIVEYVRKFVMMPDASGNLVATSSSQLETGTLPADMTAQVIDDGHGVVVSDSKGTTTALNQTESGVIASIVTNTADGRTVSQTVNIDLVLHNVHASLSHINASGFGSVNGVGLGSRMHNIGFGH